MSYSAASNVAALCQNLLGGAAAFGASTSPTSTQVTWWLSSGCAAIESRLATAGYSMPVPAGAQCYDEVANLESFYGAAMAEMSRANVRLGPGERTRGQVFMEMFDKGLDRLAKLDLTRAGVSKETYGVLYAGGISDSDREAVEEDTDRTEPRFKRDQFKYSGIVWPQGDTSAS